MTIIDGLNATELGQLLAQEAALREFDADMAYAAGFAAGFAAGHREAEEDMAAAWQALGKPVRAVIARLRGTVPEPITRPQPVDSIWFSEQELRDLDWPHATGEHQERHAA